MKNKGLFCKIIMILLIVGGLNMGLVGLGTLIGSDLNVINALLGSSPTLEAIVYLLVGLAALKLVIMMAMGKGCKS
jgi:uncharacterized membrane protein YuzA (DUF378 family)